MRNVGLLTIVGDLFPGPERMRLAGVLVMSTLAAFAEVIGIAAIMPFMALLLDPGRIEEYRAVRSVTTLFGAKDGLDAIFALGVIVIILVAVGNIISAINVIVQERFAARTKARLASEIFEGYITRPYRFHIERDTPSLIKVVVSDVLIVMGAVISPSLLAVARGLLAVGTLILLVVQNPLLALLIAVFIGSTYGAVFYLTRRREHRIAAECNQFNLDRQRVAQEGLSGIKELKVLGREAATIDRFEYSATRAAFAESSSRIAGLLPRHLLEAVTFGGILLMALLLLTQSTETAATVIPVLALYAFAGYRLLPALQQVFAAAISVRFNLPVLRGLHADLKGIRELSKEEIAGGTFAAEIHLNDEIRLSNVSFSYAGASRRSLDDVNLTIGARQTIGLVGKTGAGKTTLADLILGLYIPDQGDISIDGRTLDRSALIGWRQRVGYVPQSVFLSNSTIAENIAFGLRPEEIDLHQVMAAAKMAQADDFVTALPEGYRTVIGERGAKLSGGQRQRLGIARALYHGPDVLVFDEATSALDGLTEGAVMSAISAMRGQCTIIMIAHRIKTIENCDRIIFMEDGKISGDDTFDDLTRSSPSFKKFVGR